MIHGKGVTIDKDEDLGLKMQIATPLVSQTN